MTLHNRGILLHVRGDVGGGGLELLIHRSVAVAQPFRHFD